MSERSSSEKRITITLSTGLEFNLEGIGSVVAAIGYHGIDIIPDGSGWVNPRKVDVMHAVFGADLKAAEPHRRIPLRGHYQARTSRSLEQLGAALTKGKIPHQTTPNSRAYFQFIDNHGFLSAIPKIVLAQGLTRDIPFEALGEEARMSPSDIAEALRLLRAPETVRTRKKLVTATGNVFKGDKPLIPRSEWKNTYTRISPQGKKAILKALELTSEGEYLLGKKEGVAAVLGLDTRDFLVIIETALPTLIDVMRDPTRIDRIAHEIIAVIQKDPLLGQIPLKELSKVIGEVVKRRMSASALRTLASKYQASEKS